MVPLWLQEGLEELAARTESAPWHLAVFAWLVLAAMVLRAALIRRKLERSRAHIPLSVGGWGTRGKSGTERLKAALFQGFRYDVVVKTTGCEAMFIHARRDMPGRELFLYRPYDKATIWEQEQVLSTGRRLEGQVFLWECMALNPHFVDVLNREWMQDAVVTLTNAYPDHEDIMGPSGQDVASVIGRFMPEGGTVYTAEEQMLPVLEESARERRSELRPVSPLEADLLPLDLLQRYPYDEHPRNIALVLALARHFGLDHERSLVTMADHVVPDLGVLKTYPVVEYAGRRMSFSNGMSANERAGFLSNWQRLAFGEIDIEQQPCTYTIAVVNNRADRVPRSRVFAEIFARDVVVDRIVCIGTNLAGLRAFVAEDLDKALASVSLELADASGARAQLDETLRRYRIPTGDDAFAVRARRMLGAVVTEQGADALLAEIDDLGPCGSDTAPDEIARTLRAALADSRHRLPAGSLPWSSAQHAQLLEEVPRQVARLGRWLGQVQRERATILAAIDEEDETAITKLRTLLRDVVLRRIYLQENSAANGNQTLDCVARSFPPGFEAKLLGCQNIKGTGLDFVYRWISIGQVVDMTKRLEDPEQQQDALAGLAAHVDFGIADVRLAMATLMRLKRETSLGERVEQVDIVLRRLERTHENIVKKMDSGTKKSVWVKAANLAEPWLDHLDSVRRSRRARRIMDALFEARISQGKAAILLRDLVQRQKGGWLAKDLEALFERRNQS